jgi:hypothetical protein
MKSILLILGLGVVMMQSCKKEPCVSERIGSIKLDNKSLNTLVLKGTEKLIFKDETGKERTFIGEGKKTQTIKVEAGKKCSTGSFENINSSYFYYDLDGFFMNYRDPKSRNDVLHYTIGAYADKPTSTDTVFYDLLHCDMADSLNSNGVQYATVSGSDGVNVIASARGYKGKYTNANSGLSTNVLASTTINGKTFTNVTKANSFYFNQTFVLYYAAPKGIVAFTDAKGKSWILDRIE